VNNTGTTLFVVLEPCNEHLPKHPQKIVFGTGVGYGTAPAVDHTYKIYFVRALYQQMRWGLTPKWELLILQFLCIRFIPLLEKRSTNGLICLTFLKF
jgi:hypothetical protein